MDEPPPKEAPRSAKPERETARRSEVDYGSRPRLASDGDPAPAKALLRHAKDVWLFEIREGHGVAYTVERPGHTWPFGMLYSAESKFLREVSKTSKGGRENGV